jgi:hypothetical protein
MWNSQTNLLDHAVSVQQQIQIQLPGSVAASARASPGATLDRLQCFQQ